MVLGGGSNVLFTRGFSGVIAKNEIRGISICRQTPEDVLVSVGSGENWHQFVLWCVERGFAGIENLSLIPGTVGAAPIQNIGAYGVEIKEVLHSLEAYEIKSGNTLTFFNEDCHFSYRHSIFKSQLKSQYIITRVFFTLSRKPTFNVSFASIKHMLEKMKVSELTVKAVSQAVVNVRQSKIPDPLDVGNAGSFFKNPIIEKLHFEAIEAQFPDVQGHPVGEYVKIPAAWLIERAGWKGHRKGNVGIHRKHALILVNYGGGRGKDLLELSMEIQESIHKTFGIDLEREVNVM